MLRALSRQMRLLLRQAEALEPTCNMSRQRVVLEDLVVTLVADPRFAITELTQLVLIQEAHRQQLDLVDTLYWQVQTASTLQVVVAGLVVVAPVAPAAVAAEVVILAM